MRTVSRWRLRLCAIIMTKSADTCYHVIFQRQLFQSMRPVSRWRLRLCPIIMTQSANIGDRVIFQSTWPDSLESPSQIKVRKISYLLSFGACTLVTLNWYDNDMTRWCKTQNVDEHIFLWWTFWTCYQRFCNYFVPWLWPNQLIPATRP